jgi:hypothetical protein
VLGRLPALQELEIGSANIGNKGLISIIESLRVRPTLSLSPCTVSVLLTPPSGLPRAASTGARGEPVLRCGRPGAG